MVGKEKESGRKRRDGGREGIGEGRKDLRVLGRLLQVLLPEGLPEGLEAANDRLFVLLGLSAEENDDVLQRGGRGEGADEARRFFLRERRVSSIVLRKQGLLSVFKRRRLLTGRFLLLYFLLIFSSPCSHRSQFSLLPSFVSFLSSFLHSDLNEQDLKRK